MATQEDPDIGVFCKGSPSDACLQFFYPSVFGRDTATETFLVTFTVFGTRTV